MPSGYSPKLPLTLDIRYGYKLNQTLEEIVSQNFKMLLLTNPGERMMDPSFGVGLRKSLFEQHTEVTLDNIRDNINDQVKKYMPFLNVDDIDFGDAELDSTSNTLDLKIRYRILPLESVDNLELTITA